MNQQEQKSIETVLIVNPNSCGGSTGKNWENLYNQIKEIFGENPDVAFSQKSGDGTTLTRDFLRRGFKKIVALGGDGTINEVANGFFEVITSGNTISNDKTAPASPILKPINPDAMIGLIPSGSRNVLAKSLDLPDGIVECCQRFVNGKPQMIDVIAAVITTAEASATAANDLPKEVTTRIFLNAAEMGVGAEIIDRSKKIRDKIKSRFISTISGVIATLPTYESNLCEVSVDDGRQSLLSKMTMGVVANGRYLGGGFRAAPRASVTDGLLDITILKNSGSLKMLDEFVDMKVDSDNPEEKNNIFYMQAKKVSIKSKERDITVTLDGEPIGILPATFQVYQNALSVKL
ncbi:MAG TPA: diacylglycerol kinase family protein [Candidatus Nitrosopolaris sp.]|nr:diacylglycerol kinase family protein [Candidatus Nitrosopolaris sp.]